MNSQYRVSILIEKFEGKAGYKIIKEHSTVFDDYGNSERMFVLFVELESKIREKERMQEDEKRQGKLFKK